MFEFDLRQSHDDQQNGFDTYSKHGVTGRTNDYRISLDYDVIQDDPIFSFSPSIGAFFKDIKVTSTDGYGFGTLYSGFRSFEGGGTALNQTNSKYLGVSLGARMGAEIRRIKATLIAEALIPLKYHGDQIWYGRNPALYWKLRNKGRGNGARIKAIFGFKISDTFLKYTKIYAYYETLSMKKLTESQGGIPLQSNIDGSATFKGYGGGLAFEF